MARLEDFLAGKPVNGRMAALMRGEDEAEETAAEAAAAPRNYADGTPITKQDREHLRRLVASAGWGVLLKLLDTELQRGEDAARRISLAAGTPKEEIVAAWAEVASAKRARNGLLALAEAEVAKLKEKKNGSRFDDRQADPPEMTTILR